jgi:hypothetical protein
MKWLGILLALIIAVVAIYRINFPTYSYRYRLQLTVSVDEKLYTGSSVIEVVWKCGPQITGLGRCAPYLGGQATVIDLGALGIVVAALHSGGSVDPEKSIDAVFLCANAFGNGSSGDELPALPRLTGRRALSLSNLPRLVWFPSPADMNSARKITVENFANVINATARFTEAFVEISRDPIIVDIPTRLPWFSELQRQQKEGKGALWQPRKFQLVYNMFVGENS